jgi:hypothetical protein
MSIYGVWVQPLDDDTGEANFDRYGMVENLSELYESDMGDRSKDFCDGQTSPTAPRYADDQMGQLQFYSKEAADYVAAVLRNDIAERIAMGQLNRELPAVWGVLQPVTAPASMLAKITGIREAMALADTVTDSQIEGGIVRYVQATGNPLPTDAELIEWMAANTAW